MKQRISERYSGVVLLILLFLASIQVWSQTRAQHASKSQVLVRLSDLQLKLSPRSEQELLESPGWNRAPAAVSVISPIQPSSSAKKKGKAIQLPLTLSPEPVSIERLATDSIQKGRDLSPSFKSNPYYIPACSELIRF